MSCIHLKEFAKEKGQPEAAHLLGLTQGALSKAIRVGRNVLITELPDGSFSAEERRPFPYRSEPRSAAKSGATLNTNLCPISAAHQPGTPSVQTSSTSQASP